MSDTGGGHRASAEAIWDAFKMEYGDQCRLWSMAFHGTSPRWIHDVYHAAIAAFYAKEVEAGLMEYKPAIIISVHPLMQHIPLLVLKWQGLQKKVIFVTVMLLQTLIHATGHGFTQVSKDVIAIRRRYRTELY